MSLTVGEGMRARVLRGMAWKGASQIAVQGSRVVVAVVLARLLAPHDYGLAGMVLVFSALILVFSDLALGAAIVQRRDLTEGDRSTVFWTSLGAGVAFTALVAGVSGWVADFYGEPAVRGLLAVLSLSFVVSSLGATHGALLTRSMDFRRLELCGIAGTAAGAVVGIGVAARGYGAWAIVTQQLASAAVTTALLWLVTPWRPRAVFSLTRLRRIAAFSGNVFGQRLLYYLHRNVDNLLVGRFLGASALGAYAVAYNVMLLPFSRIAGPIQEVLFPAFSRMQDDRERMAAVWIRVTRIVGAFSMPALLGLAVVAPDLVPVVLGPRWDAAIPVVQILVWVGLLQSLQTVNSDILQALDRTGTLLRYSMVFFCAHLAAFVLGLRWGIVGVAAAYAISSTLVEPLYAWVTARAVGISPWTWLRGLRGVAQASAIMLASVAGARVLLLEAGVSPGARLAALVVLGAAVYLPACALLEPALLAEARRFRPRARTAEAAVT